MWLTTFVKRHLVAFGAGRGERGEARRALAALYRDIERRGPRWYNPWTDRLSPRFAESAQALREALRPLGSTFAATIAGDKAAERAAMDALLAHALAPSGLSLGAFDFEAIKAEAERRGGELLTAMDELWEQRSSALRSRAVARLSMGYRILDRLAALWEYDFEGLLARFERRGGAGPSFGSCEGARAAPSLADLYFIVSGLEAGREAVEAYGILRALAGAEGGGEADPAAEMVAVAAMLSKDFRADRLAAVLRAIRNDAALELKAYDAPCAACDARLEELASRYAEKRARLAEGLAEAELAARRRELFGDRELEVMAGYTEEVSAFLRERGFPGLERVASMRIIKSFVGAYYLPVVRVAVSALIVDAEFADEGFHRDFVEAADRCAALAASLRALEEELSSPLSSGLRLASDAAGKGRLDAAERKAASDAIEQVERRCDLLIQGTFSAFGGLRNAIGRVLADARSKRPELLANALFLARSKASLLAELEKCARLLDSCLRFLRFFSIDAGELGRAVGLGDGDRLEKPSRGGAPPRAR